MLSGVIAIDKPKGFTSFDVVAKLRGIFKERRIGHSGTLDPLATGVLPVFLGKAARAADILPDPKKRYTAGFAIGFETDTQDISGAVIKTGGKKISRERLEEILPAFSGEISQTPPMYSAVKIGGKRLYQLAREGKTVERPSRSVTVFEIKLDGFDESLQKGVLSVECSKGTYIRTLINDIGEALGSFAAMTSLRRTYSQGFDISDCLSIEAVEEATRSGSAQSLLAPVERCFECYPKMLLDPLAEKKYKNGVLPAAPESLKNGFVRVFGSEFLGICEVSDGALKIYRNFWGD